MKRLLRILSIIFNVKRRTMSYWFYLELESVEDIVNIDTTIIGGAKGLINDTDLCIDNNMPDTYPDFVFMTENSEPTCLVNNSPVEPQPLLGGYHPSQRPPVRNK